MTRQYRISVNIIILFLTAFFVYSCGGKKEEQPVVKEAMVPKADTLTEYFPAQYEEEVEDTLLDAGSKLRLVIKRYTQMENSVVQFFDDSNSVRKFVYRDNALSVRLTKGAKVLLDTVLTKQTIAAGEDIDFLVKSVMHEAAFENYDSDRKVVLISCVVSVPESEWSSHYFIHLDRNGKIDIQVDDVE
jgi:hypothetical protein